MTQHVEEKASVGAKELTAVFTVYTASHAFLGFPRYAGETAYEAGWMLPLIAGAISIAAFLAVDAVIARRFPGMDIIEIATTCFGKVSGTLVSLCIVAFLLATNAMVFREFSENVVSTVLPFTPIFLVGGLAMLTALYIAWMGLEGIARTAYILFPVLLVGIVSLCVLTVNWWHPAWLFPVFGRGLPAVLQGGLHACSLVLNVVLLTIVYPHAHNPKDLRRVGVVSIALSSVLVSMFIMAYQMVFPAPGSPSSPFPLYQLARMIYVGRYMQRLESVYVFLWVTAALAKLAVSLWAMGYILASACEWPSFRPALPAMAMLCFALGMWPPNVGLVLHVYDVYYMPWGWLLSLGMPLAVAGLAFAIRGRKRGMHHA